MQLCSGNNYPDCCKHNHLTSAADEGGEGVILLVLGQTGSPGAGGDMCLFTIEKLHSGHWLQWPAEILDVTDTPGGSAS